MFTMVGGSWMQRGTWSVWVALVAVGCGPLEGAPGEEGRELGQQGQHMQRNNGLSMNGLSMNGLSMNGLSMNGLSMNGLSTPTFSDWFDADPSTHEETMRYVVYCAVPEGQTRSYTSSMTGETYTWQGSLGLAAGWASGLAATEQEQQVVSACLGAHVNAFGLHVSISLLGKDGAGNVISYTSQELQEYSVTEGCFFGNLFQSDMVKAGNDGLALGTNQSSTRVCAVAGTGSSSQCSPMEYVGSCSQYCTKDASNTYYVSCTYGGRTYRPLNTRLRTQEVSTCGDSVCGESEQRDLPGYCAQDCG